MKSNFYITVTDNFVEIYKMFNVNKQTDKMKLLSRKELMLLLILAIDSFSEENTAVIENFREFKLEMQLIFNLQQDLECDDEDLINLGIDTDEKYIDTSKIRDSKGEELPTALTDEEAIQIRREIGISNIIE